jgi:hypothetical protein
VRRRRGRQLKRQCFDGCETVYRHSNRSVAASIRRKPNRLSRGAQACWISPAESHPFAPSPSTTFLLRFTSHTTRQQIRCAYRPLFFEFDQAERLETAALFNDYGIQASVQCGSPRYRLLPVGTVFPCSVMGSPAVSELRLRAESNGQLFTFNPTGFSTLMDVKRNSSA